MSKLELLVTDAHFQIISWEQNKLKKTTDSDHQKNAKNLILEPVVS